jgi:transposase
VWRVIVRARLRRLACHPCDRVVIEAVPFARHGARFTRDTEDLVAWLAQRTDKTTITRLVRINWRTVGAIIERVVADQLDNIRLDGLYDIGIDEVSYRKQHHYLTVITDHTSGKVEGTGEGKNAAAAGAFFDDLGADRADRLRVISLDMGAAYRKAPPRPSSASTRSTSWRCATGPSTRCAATTGTCCARPPSPPTPGRSRVPGKRCCDAPTTSSCPNASSSTRSVSPARRCGGRTRSSRPFGRCSTATWTPTCYPAFWTAGSAGHSGRGCPSSFASAGPCDPAHRHPRRHPARDQQRPLGGRLNNVVRLITRRGYGFHSPAAVAALVMLTCGRITTEWPTKSGLISYPYSVQKIPNWRRRRRADASRRRAPNS